MYTIVGTRNYEFLTFFIIESFDNLIKKPKMSSVSPAPHNPAHKQHK